MTIIYSEQYKNVCDAMEVHQRRFGLWASLAAAYGLFSHNDVKLVRHQLLAPKIPPILSSWEDLTEFHSEEFVQCLQKSFQSPQLF